MPKLLTSLEVAKILKCPTSWVHTLCSTGALKAIRVTPRSSLRFTKEEIQNFALRTDNVITYTQPAKVRNELFCLYYEVTEKQRKEILRGQDFRTITRQLLWQRLNIAKGLCPVCGKKPAPGIKTCPKCQARSRKSYRAFVKKKKRAKNPISQTNRGRLWNRKKESRPQTRKKGFSATTDE